MRSAILGRVPGTRVLIVDDHATFRRFARLVLPGDETLAVYAVQRLDKADAIEAMRGLRRLFAATHPVAG